MYFFRIKDNGYDTNGNHTYRVYGYRDDELYIDKNHFRMLDGNALSMILPHRRKNRDYITTQRTKDQILESLEKALGNENFFYAFE